ncbi:hypothetical protein B0A55_03952 [Friedmanniomyces simplex]|uniref:NACHT domain-containing protein n=1 Tax=Friedmanniomyces simplex TaxID=329884 RepID=A0A4U0XRM5_9PEZI|nr:hypothetical protein B0A55_03952 [Friedmanniomyces simplex]
MVDCFASMQHAVQAQEAQLSRIEGMLPSDRDRRLVSEIVDGLAHAVMSSRRKKIEDHHQETFGWIFSETETPFKRWLADSGGIFWVSGEAGSGKSTLMKFLRAQSATERVLQGWSLGKTLLILEHSFFWVAGSLLQKTMEGWKAEPLWTYDALIDALLKLAEAGPLEMCCFIDGLDECEESMHRQLIRDMKRMADCPNVKICISSRPWFVFEQAFGTSRNKILVQDLTLHDIFCTARDRLAEEAPPDMGFDACQEELFDLVSHGRSLDPESFSHEQHQARTLVHGIVSKAKGVLLWVTVMLNNLCDRLRAGQSASELRHVLEQFPDNLEDYLQNHIYARISPTFRGGPISDTAMALKIATVAHQAETDSEETEQFASSFLFYWLVQISLKESQGLVQDAAFGLNHGYEQYMNQEFHGMIASTRCYLGECCKDLLAVTQLPGKDVADRGGGWTAVDARVEFRHRMFFDFVMTEKMQSTLAAHVPAHFLDGL